MNMPTITKVKQLEDRVILSYHFRNGTRIPDTKGIIEILHADIPSLPKEPPLPKNDGTDYWAESFIIEKLNLELAYHFEDWQETCDANMQYFHGGPYLRSPPKPK